MGRYFSLIFSLLTWENRVGKFGAPLITECTNYNWKKKRYQWVHTLANQPLQVRPYFPSLAQYSGAKVKGATKTYNFCKLLSAGLLIFCAVAEPQNSLKSAKSREIHKNTQTAAKFAWNHIEYMLIDCFSAKFASKIPVKIPQNRPILPWICPWKSRKNWLFSPRLIRSPVSGIVRQFSFCFFRGKLLYRLSVNNKLTQ